MKSGIKAGVLFIGGSLTELIICDIYPILKEYIINKTIPSLSSLSPLWIVEITIAFCFLGLGAFLILKGKYVPKMHKKHELPTNQEIESNFVVEIKDKYWYLLKNNSIPFGIQLQLQYF